MSKILAFLFIATSTNSYSSTPKECFKRVCHQIEFNRPKMPNYIIELNSFEESKVKVEELRPLMIELMSYAGPIEPQEFNLTSQEIQDLRKEGPVRCLDSFAKKHALLPSDKQIIEFTSELSLDAYLDSIGKLIGSQSKNVLRNIFGSQFKLDLPMSQEDFIFRLKYRINDMIENAKSGKEKVSIRYVCGGRTPKGSIWSVKWDKSRDGGIDKASVTLGKANKLQAVVSVSADTIVEKDYFTYAHELSHIVEILARRRFLPKSGFKTIKNYKKKILKRSSKIDLSLMLGTGKKDSTFEVLPDYLASFVMKDLGLEAKYPFICRKLNKELKRYGTLDLGYNVYESGHDSGLTRVLSSIKYIEGDIPNQCRFIYDRKDLKGLPHSVY